MPKERGSRAILRTPFYLGATCVVLAASPTAGLALDRKPGPAIRSAQSNAPVPFHDVLQFVRLRGWRANLDKLCAEFGMPEGRDNCTFRQISIQDAAERGYPRGFNVSDFAGPKGRYVLIFHLQPLVGEFFLVSSDGALIRAFYRAKGRGYDPLPNEDIRSEFEADLNYWLEESDTPQNHVRHFAAAVAAAMSALASIRCLETSRVA